MNDDVSNYGFAELGERLAASLVTAAEDQVSRAQQILDQTRSMAEIIRTQVAAQTKQIEAMNARFRAFGEQMLDAHRMLNGDAAPRTVGRLGDQLETDTHQLRAMVDLERSRGSVRSIAGDDIPVVAPHRAKPQDRDGNQLPRSLGSGEPGAAAVAGAGRHARDNGADRGTDPFAAGPPYRETSTTRD
jgi:hypothetical protein